MNNPCGVGSNQWVAKRKDANFFWSIKYMTKPPSTLLRANLSGAHDKIPIGSVLDSTRVINSLNTGRPGVFALFDSVNSARISIFSLRANSRNSKSCASIDMTCLSSSSVDLRAYRKYFGLFILFLDAKQTNSPFLNSPRRANSPRSGEKNCRAPCAHHGAQIGRA